MSIVEISMSVLFSYRTFHETSTAHTQAISKTTWIILLTLAIQRIAGQRILRSVIIYYYFRI